MNNINKLKTALLLFFLGLNYSIAQSYTAPKVTSLPIFDGNGNDAVWNDATWKNIDQIWIPYNNILPSSYTTESGTQILNGATDFAARYKILWSQTSSVILFLVEVHDDAFIDGYQQSFGGTYPNYDILEIFIDENKSGGNHLFDLNGNNAENAFAYHMALNKPAVGQVITSMTGAMDLYGTSYSNIIDYQSHFSNFSFKNLGNGDYVYEFALKVYTDTYNNSNPAASLRTLNLNDNLGLTIAYCDNDQNDVLRDHFIASVAVAGPDNNNTYINASLFGTLILGPSNNLSVSENEISLQATVFPNPFTKSFNLSIPESITLTNTVLKMYDVWGREIKSVNINNHQTTIERNDLNTGFYLYKISNNEKIISSGRILAE